MDQFCCDVSSDTLGVGCGARVEGNRPTVSSILMTPGLQPTTAYLESHSLLFCIMVLDHPHYLPHASLWEVFLHERFKDSGTNLGGGMGPDTYETLHTRLVHIVILRAMP
jgi:hypothetical protein